MEGVIYRNGCVFNSRRWSPFVEGVRILKHTIRILANGEIVNAF